MRMKRLLAVSLFTSLTAAASADSPPADLAPPAPTTSQTLDRLYARLAKTRLPEEAQGILTEIGHLRLQSGSDTADLLLNRAMKARGSSQLDLSLQLFDSVVTLYPDWSEAWSARATARFQKGDLDGAVADLAQTLKREPRDIGALAGLGAILADSGQAEGALRAYDRALALAPAFEPLQEARARAQNKLWSLTP